MKQSKQSGDDRQPGKPQKPYPDFPLFAHNTGRWAKKIRGRLHYFGPWRDPQAALARYLEERDALQAGRVPVKRTRDSATVAELCNTFLSFKDSLVQNGELAFRTWEDYKRCTDAIVAVLGKHCPVDEIGPSELLELRDHLAARRRNPKTLGDEIARCRVVFNFAYDQGMTDRKVRFGQAFRRPRKGAIRTHRAERDRKHGKRFFDAAELRELIDRAGTQLRAMILLGVNCGFGNSDCGKLPMQALQLEGTPPVVDFARPKTGIERVCPLWPETVEAIRVVLATRRQPEDSAHADLVFISKRSSSWYKPTRSNPISAEFRKLCRSVGCYREGRGFYALRHTFETIGGESRDQVAVNIIMGHADNSMAAEYREGVSIERLQAVTDLVRRWFKRDGDAEQAGPGIVRFPGIG